MSDEKAPAAEPQQTAIPDYDNEDIDALEARFRDGEGMIQVEESSGEPASEPVEPEPEPDRAAEEPVAEETAPPEGVDEEPAAEPEPAPVEEDFDETRSLLEETRLQLAKTEQERQKFEFLAGRHTGELGHLRKLVEQLQTGTVPADTDSTDEYGEPVASAPAPVPVDTGLQSRVAELESDLNREAATAAYDSFVADNKLFVPAGVNGEDAEKMEAEITQLMADMKPHIERARESYSGLELSRKATRKVVRMMLDSAYTEVKLDRLRKQRAEALEKRASQVDSRRLAKQAAAPSGSGAAPAPKPRPKRIEDMTAEEADAEMIRLSGERTSHFQR